MSDITFSVSFSLGKKKSKKFSTENDSQATKGENGEKWLEMAENFVNYIRKK